MVVTLGEAEEALEESVLLLLLLAGGLLGVGGRGLLVELGTLGGDTTHAGTKTSLEAGDDDGDHGILGSAGKNVLESLSDSLSDHLGEHVDDSLKKTDLSAHDLDVASNRVDVAVQGVKVGMKGTNLATDGIDMLTDGVDMTQLGIVDGAMIVIDAAHVVDMSTKVVDIDTKGTSSVKKSMLDHTEDLLEDGLSVELSDTMATIISMVLDGSADLSENSRHVDTTSVDVLLNSAVLNGVVNSMLDETVQVGLAMKTLNHVRNAGLNVVRLGVLTTETITLSNGAGELDKEDSGLTHAVPLRAGGITTSLAKTNEASVVIEHGLHVIVRSSGARELSVGASLGKVTTHGLNHDGAVGTTIDDNSDGGLGRGHVTSTVTLGGGSDRAVSHGAISDRGLNVNARVNGECRGLGRLVLGGDLGVDRKLGLSRSHCFGLVVGV